MVGRSPAAAGFHMQESNIFGDVFGRNASACFELRAFSRLHYIPATRNIGCFPLGKRSSSGVLMSSVLMSSILTSRLSSVLLLEAKWLSSASVWYSAR